MSLRFNRNVQPSWNRRSSWVEFACNESQSRTPVRCAVSRAALEDVNGTESLDAGQCVAVFARHLARITTVANTLYAAHRLAHGGLVLVDTDDLSAAWGPVLADAAAYGQIMKQGIGEARGLAG